MSILHTLIYIYISYDIIGMDMSALHTLICINKLWYYWNGYEYFAYIGMDQISYINVWMDMSTLRALVWIKLVMIIFEWTWVP
jgi:hypothetical protein